MPSWNKRDGNLNLCASLEKKRKSEDEQDEKTLIKERFLYFIVILIVSTLLGYLSNGLMNGILTGILIGIGFILGMLLIGKRKAKS